jgi:selenocysteine lyase/cysteine desulfurase
VVWDYTAAAPYLPVRMREPAGGGVHAKDAVVFSPHKFVGGPQTPGVLVVRRQLVRSPVPSTPGGGTIAFVGPGGALYVLDPVGREEGGTPAIVESVRAGLVVALKEAVGTDAILALERRCWQRAWTAGAPTRTWRSSATSARRDCRSSPCGSTAGVGCCTTSSWSPS